MSARFVRHAAALLTLSAACDQKPLPPSAAERDTAKPNRAPIPKDLPSDRHWSSEHFEFHARGDDDSVCESLLDQFELHFRTLQGALRFPWPERQKVAYYKYLSGDDLGKSGSCSAFNAACFYADLGVQTAAPMHLHELVHAYLAPLGRRHMLLEEGLADALSCAHQVRGKPEPPALEIAFNPDSWRSNTFANFRELYGTASWFTGYLLNTQGAARFMDFYTRLMPEDDAAAAALTFSDVYGNGLADVWEAAFEASDPDTACYRIWECAQPPWAPPFEHCSRPHRVGTFDLEDPSWVLQESSGFGSTVGSCGDTPVPHQDWLSAANEGQQGEVFALALEAGRYFVAESPRFDATRVELIDRSPSAHPPDTCSDVIPLQLDSVTNITFAFHSTALAALGAAAEGATWISWAAPAGATVGQDSFEITCSDSTPIEWCGDCGDCTPACDTTVMVERTERAAGVGALRLAAPDSEAHWVRLRRTY